MPPEIKVRVLGQAATGPAFAIATDEVRSFGDAVRETMTDIGRTTSTAAKETAPLGDGLRELTGAGAQLDAAAQQAAAGTAAFRASLSGLSAEAAAAASAQAALAAGAGATGAALGDSGKALAGLGQEAAASTTAQETAAAAAERSRGALGEAAVAAGAYRASLAGATTEAATAVSMQSALAAGAADASAALDDTGKAMAGLGHETAASAAAQETAAAAAERSRGALGEAAAAATAYRSSIAGAAAEAGAAASTQSALAAGAAQAGAAMTGATGAMTALAQATGATATVQETVAAASDRARAALGGVGTTVVALRQRETELTNELKLGRISTATYAQEMQALQVRIAATAAAVQVGSREHERLAQVAGRVQTALRGVATGGASPLEAAVADLTAQERSLADQHRLGQISAQEYQTALTRLRADVATLALQTSAGSEEQARLAQVAGSTQAALQRLDLDGVTPLAGEIAALTQRQRELDQQLALGSISLGEYQNRARTLKADISELAARTALGSREHERLAGVAGTVDQSLARLSAQERRNVDAAEAVAAGVQTMSSAMSGGGVAAVTSFTSVLQRFSRGSPAMVSFLGGAGALISVVALITAEWKKAAGAAEEAQRAQDDTVRRFGQQFQVIRRQMSEEQRLLLEEANIAAARAERDSLPARREVVARTELQFNGERVERVVTNRPEVEAAERFNANLERRRAVLEQIINVDGAIVATSRQNFDLNRQTNLALERQAALVKTLGDEITAQDLRAARVRLAGATEAEAANWTDVQLAARLASSANAEVANWTDVQLAEWMRAWREVDQQAQTVARGFGDYLRQEMPELFGERPGFVAGPQLFSPASPFYSASFWQLGDEALERASGVARGTPATQPAFDAGLQIWNDELSQQVADAVAGFQAVGFGLDGLTVPAREFRAEWDQVTNTLADGAFYAGIESLSSVLTGSARGLSGFGRVFATIMGDTLITAGKSAIGIGTFAEALRKALAGVFSGGGLLAIGVGAGLIALGGLIKGAVAGSAAQISLGFGGGSGGFGSTIGADLSGLTGAARGGETTVNLYGDRFTADELSKLLEELRDRRIGDINFFPASA